MIKSGMTLDELKKQYGAMNVVFKDDFTLKRAIMYYSFVRDTYNFFSKDTKEKLRRAGGEYEKVASALIKPDLLTGLCKILDMYLIDAVNDALQAFGQNYGDYFAGIFQDYPRSVEKFFDVYLNSRQALIQLTSYFQQNVLTACQRVLDDWGYLQGMFVSQKNNFLDKLVGIRSTGSDFHKGGQQVLILTFSTTTGERLPIVYKPSDLEVDCLITGDTEAVNVFRPNFQQASLMELLNTLAKTHPDLGLYEFPKYKILPISPGSKLRRDKNGQLPIRTSYGYIQFLSYDGIITSSMNEKEICTRFYTLLGQLTAVACAFSLSDLHIQNLIVHQYMPYLIDLENSLTRSIRYCIDTEMFGEAAIDSGAINGVVGTQKTYSANDRSKQIQEESRYSREKNRLWGASGALISTVTYWEPMLKGFTNTMALIHNALQSGQPFKDWFDRLKSGAIVRIVPRGSDKFQNAVIYTFSPKSKNRQKLADAATESMEEALSSAYNDWVKTQTDPPRFLCFQPAYVLEDIISCDVPVFYHQLNTSDVMDSWGRTIMIPDTITIKGEQKPVKSLLGRNTYFSHLPLNDVQNVQLATNSSPEKVKELLNEMHSRIELAKDVKQYKDLLQLGVVDEQ
jgi:hypothetical protein